DVCLAARPTPQAQLRRRRLVREMHHDAACRTKCDDVWLLAPGHRCLLGARAVFLLVIGGKTPTPDDVLRRESPRAPPARRRPARLIELWAGGTSGQPQRYGDQNDRCR